MFFSLDNIARVLAGRWLVSPASDIVATGVSTDSRAVGKGEIFIALAGEKFDGHDFLATAAQCGAAMLIVHKQPSGPSASAPSAPRSLDPSTPFASTPVLLVNDTLAALQQLAAAYRDDLAARRCVVIAVVGSNGKTTTRNLIHAALAASLPGSQSPKSFNNHIGVPLTLLGERGQEERGQGVKGSRGQGTEELSAARSASASAPSTPRPLDPLAPSFRSFVVVEVGTNHPGEIDALGKIVRPDAVAITSIGEEHMEFFRTLDGVAREEAAILPHVKPGGFVAVSEQAFTAMNAAGVWSPRPDLTIMRYGPSAPSASGALAPSSWAADADGLGQSFRLDDTCFKIPLMGPHNGVNALAAIVLGRWLGLSDARLAAGLAGVRPVSMRADAKKLGDPALSHRQVLLINDAYNANPSSVSLSIPMLAATPTPAPQGRRILILGDMFELGDDAPNLHRKVGSVILDAVSPAADRLAIDVVVFIGRLSMHGAEIVRQRWPAHRVHVFPAWNDALPGVVASLIEPGDAVLLKASRGMGLERLVPAIEAKFAAPAAMT